MKIKSAFSQASILLILLLPFLLGSSNQLIQQEEERFYLSNYTSFSPGSRVTINLYSYGNYTGDYYNFKLLRISDPLKFFTSINRSQLRGNFDIWGNEKESLLKFTEVVREWRDRVDNPAKYGYRNNVNVGVIDEPGIYIVQAAKKHLVAYCGIAVSDLALIYKNSSSQIIAFTADSKSSEFISNVKFNLYSGNKLTESKISDKDGLVLFELSDPKSFNSDEALLIAQTGKETIVSDPYFYFNTSQQNYMAYVYTNQPVYRPGQEVFFKAIFRQKNGNEIKNVPDEEFTVTIKSPRNKEVYSQNLKSSEYGSISGNFILDEEADLGHYNIELSKNEMNYHGSFSVEEYKKPEYHVTVKTERDQYSGKEIIKGEVTADYYFGSPVINAKVNLNIFKNAYWRPWWYWSDYAWFYRSFSSSKMIYHPEKELIHQISGELNSEGKFEFEYQVEKDMNADYTYNFSAEVTDYSRRAIAGSKDVFITRGNFTLSTSTEKYFYEKGKEVKIRVNASDFSEKPVQTNIKIAVGYPNPDNRSWHSNPISFDTLYGSTDASGRAVIIFNSRYNYSGHYSYTVFAYDEKGREITAASSFFMGNEKDYWYYRDNSGLEIITDKDSYDKGDSLVAHVFLPSENTQLLMTYETDKILGYKKYDVKENSFTIREKLTDEFSPSFNISITYVKERQFNTTTKLIGVLAKDKFLDISINRNKNEYKPGEQAEYTILVKDHNGNPVKNTELSLGIVDESIYAIQQDNTPAIQTFFYAPSYSYIPVYSSLQRHSFNGSSRRFTYADRDFSEAIEKGEESLYGRVKIKNRTDPAADIFIIVTNNEGYYTTRTDSTGNYRIENIAAGTYEILTASADGVPVFIDRIKIDGSKKFDIEFEANEFFVQDNLAREDVQEQMAEGAPMMKLASANSGAVSLKGGYVEAELRSNFVDASVWKAHIVTDGNGEASVSFKMPDNLTTWRTTVKGITPATDVGEQTDKVITRKNLLVRMETPRFFREGDELTISTMIHNYLNEKKKTKISFNADNVKLIDSRINTPGYSTIMFNQNEGMYELTVDKNSEVRIDWKVQVLNPVGEAVLTAEALTNEESDAVQLKVPVLPKGYKEVKAFSVDFSDPDKEEVIQFNIPSDVDLRTANVSFNAAPSLAGTILKALDDLVAYPYGCVEQTMSRFLPAIIAANTFREINAPLKASTLDKLPEVVDAGLKRLYNFQHDDGGWGWWEYDQTNAYMTAYVIYGMSLAKEAGYKIDEAVYSSGIDHLKQLLSDSKEKDETTLSFMLYSLSYAVRSGDTDYQDYEKRIKNLLNKKPGSYSLSLLIISAENFNNKLLAEELTGRLVQQAEVDQNTAHWGGKQFHYRWQDDNVQGTAFAVKALLKTGSNSELINKAVKWLLIQKQGFSWRSTQETAAVIFALTDYLKITQELNPEFTISVFLNDVKIFDKYFRRDDIFKETETIKISGADKNNLKSGLNKIKIIKKGAGKLYFSGLNNYYTQNQTAAAKVKRFDIRREYFVLKPVKKDDRIVHVKEKFNGTVNSGEDIFVKTYVESEGDNLQYFILEDMLPSGFEAVKDESNYFIEEENDYNQYYPYPTHRPWRWFYADKEYRDEKIAFFVTYVNPQMEFSYIIKAQIPGEYKAMPTNGYLMYFPEVSGSSGMIDIEVKE